MEAAKVLEVVWTLPLEGILKTVATLAAQEISLFRGFKKELAKLRQSLLAIQDFLADVAYQPQDRGVAVRDWMKKLKDVAQDADDALDEINYELLRRKVEGKRKKVLNFFSNFNPILFRQEMALKIKNINASLMDLKSEASFIGLVAKKPDPTPQGMGSRETVSSFGHDEKIFGREEVLSDIIKILIDSKSQENYLSVMAIVGMAGLGKTTLAKSIYNDECVVRHFVEKIWVCVSNTFDVNSILNRMLESLNSGKTGLQSQEALLNNLKQKLTGKRYILILDDIWTEDEILWSNLMSCLSKLDSARGSVIVVTTRNANVASITGTLPPCDLGNLSVEDCWSILRGEAFVDGSAVIDSNLETIGRAIAEKCVGVPLVAKVLGSMMRSKNSIDEWISIQESKIWELPKGEKRIMSILKLSFDHLKLSSLKQCFAYCSIFEKDAEIERDDLIQLWMGQGFLHSSPNKDMECVGNEYFNILVESSLFQDVKKDKDGIITECKMHDLVHDLSELVSKSEMEDKLEIQHVTWDPSKISESISVGKLRTMFLNSHQALSNSLLIRFKALRMLTLCGSDVEELPGSIGELKHLRYLNISGTKIKQLPNSIGKLYNLQTLRMQDAWELETFPKELENLINLRHVYFDDEMEVPFEMRRLTHLQTLPSFTLDKARSHGIDELGGLNNLKGKLVIRYLEFVRDRDEAKKSMLVGKRYIRRLTFEWGNSREGKDNNDLDVLEGLQPNPELERLDLENFMGAKLASWMISGLLLLNLKEIRLYNCRECEEVPVLGHLPNLVSVDFRLMTKLKCVGAEFYGYNHAATSSKRDETGVAMFPALKTFRLTTCPTLIEWKEAVVMPTEKVSIFPCLEELTIEDCMELRNAPTHFPSLKKLKMWSIDSFMPIENISSQLTSLTSLQIEGIKELITLPVGMVEKNQNLRSLVIGNCKKLRHLPDGLHTLPLLEELTIKMCSSLESIPIRHDGITSLRELNIQQCRKLSSLSSGLEYCTSLEILRIKYCPNLTSIPISNVLPSLLEVEIVGCQELSSLPGALECSTSLQDLSVRNCRKLRCISIHSLTSLRLLVIYNCGATTSLRSGPQHLMSSTGALEELSLHNCTSLYDLTIERCNGFTSILSGLQSCTSLRSLHIWNCQRLRHLPLDGLQTLVSLEHLLISHCPNLEAIPSLNNLTSLTNLQISSCHNLISLADQQVSTLQSLTRLTIFDCGKLQHLPTGIHSLTRLKEMRIGKFWEELDSFPGFEVPSQLERLTLSGWPKLKSLPQQIQHSTSLTYLTISYCENLMYLPTVEAMRRLTKLQELCIFGCSVLKKRCAKENGPEWPKISHIPNIIIDYDDSD